MVSAEWCALGRQGRVFDSCRNTNPVTSDHPAGEHQSNGHSLHFGPLVDEVLLVLHNEDTKEAVPHLLSRTQQIDVTTR